MVPDGTVRTLHSTGRVCCTEPVAMQQQKRPPKEPLLLFSWAVQDLNL